MHKKVYNMKEVQEFKIVEFHPHQPSSYTYVSGPFAVLCFMYM